MEQWILLCLIDSLHCFTYSCFPHYLILRFCAGNSGYEVFTLLSTSSRGHTIKLSPIWCYCQPLCPCNHQWQNWTTIWGRPQLQRIFLVFLRWRSHPAWLLVGHIEGLWRREMVEDVEETESHFTPLWVPTSSKERWCCEHDLQTGAKKAATGEALATPFPKIENRWLVATKAMTNGNHTFVTYLKCREPERSTKLGNVCKSTALSCDNPFLS